MHSAHVALTSADENLSAKSLFAGQLFGGQVQIGRLTGPRSLAGQLVHLGIRVAGVHTGASP
jgi:hypothetical protein